MNICVFGAASNKIAPVYIEEMEKLGLEIGKRGHNLVFGAGGCGVMGATARGVVRGGGKVYGVIPEFFRDENIEEIFDGCTELIFTKTMHERKKTMEDLADAFIIAPGGIGTMEEFFEVLTHKQLARHSKPIAIFNLEGFFDLLERFTYSIMNKRFIKSNCDLLYLTFTDPDELFDYVEHLEGSFGMSVHDFK